MEIRTHKFNLKGYNYLNIHPKYIHRKKTTSIKNN